MDIRSNLMYVNNALNESYAAKASATAAKESKLAVGKKLAGLSSDAASLQIKSKAGEGAALENISAASSAVEDVAKAEAMIREANRRILEQSDDSVLAQANQTTDAVTKLLD